MLVDERLQPLYLVAFSHRLSGTGDTSVIYQELLKGDFERLPRALREFHSSPGGGRAVGSVSVRHQSRLVAWLVGFPPRGDKLSMQLEVTASEDHEVWVRRFGDFILKSVQRRSGELLSEAFGPVRMLIRILADETGMEFISERASWWMIPIPLRVRARALGHETSWDFEVTIAGVGSYGGTVAPV